MTWQRHIEARLREIRPATVCTLDDAAHDVARAILGSEAARRCLGAESAPACTLALGVDALRGLALADAQHLIHHTRLYVAPHLLLVAAADCALDEDAFRALGFTLSFRDEAGGVRVHEYNLETYKSVPDWLNARFWAHPERWEP